MSADAYSLVQRPEDVKSRRCDRRRLAESRGGFAAKRPGYQGDIETLGSLVIDRSQWVPWVYHCHEAGGYVCRFCDIRCWMPVIDPFFSLCQLHQFNSIITFLKQSKLTCDCDYTVLVTHYQYPLRLFHLA